MGIAMTEYGIGLKSIKWGNDSAIRELPHGANNDKVKKNYNFKDIKHLVGQSHAIGCMDFAQMVLALATNVETFCADKSPQDKFEILVGDIELLYQESVGTMNTAFKLEVEKPSIESIMTMRKKWSVSVVERTLN